MIDIEELKRLRDADAPTGTWGACPMQYDHGHEGGYDDWVVYLERTEERGHGGLVCADLPKESAEYIAALNNAVPGLIERLEAAERDSLKYRALLASAGDREPESLEKLLPAHLRPLYIRPDTIHQFEAAHDVQMIAHILVSERHGKFDLIHLVAYLIGQAEADAQDAGRYRWLREPSHFVAWVQDGDCDEPVLGTRLDAGVDYGIHLGRRVSK